MRGRPSTIQRGSVRPVRLFSPRMVIFARVPGAPDRVVLFSPAMVPSRIRSMELIPCVRKSFAVITEALPVMWSFLIVSIPVTTTSSSSATSSSMITEIICSPSTSRCTGFIPINVKPNIFFPCGMLILNRPLGSVTVPIVVPLKITATPGKSIPCLSFTTPEIRCCEI